LETRVGKRQQAYFERKEKNSRIIILSSHLLSKQLGFANDASEKDKAEMQKRAQTIIRKHTSKPE
jgi:hypothetical protein